MTGKWAFIVIMASLVSSAACQQPISSKNTRSATANPATMLCSRPAANGLSCGWASRKEQDQAFVDQCPYCGTMWTGESVVSPLPIKVQGVRSYWQYAAHIVSLGCPRGKLQVRTVFRLLPGSTGCTRLAIPEEATGSLASKVSAVKRCRVALPSGAAPKDAAAAAKAQDVKGSCIEGRCTKFEPAQKANVWYSDTVTLQWAGCTGVLAQAGKTYTPTMPAVIVNPGNKYELADFSVKPVN